MHATKVWIYNFKRAVCEKYLCKRKCIGIYNFFICPDMLSLLILECDILFYVYAIPSKVLITFAAFQFYVSSFQIFADLGWSWLVDLGWLISTLKILVGWSLTNFCINRAIKTFPLAQSCSPALCWTWSLSTLYRPILVNQQEKMFWLCRRATKMAKNYQKALLSWLQWL